jgi:hypothetical protein
MKRFLNYITESYSYNSKFFETTPLDCFRGRLPVEATPVGSGHLLKFRVSKLSEPNPNPLQQYWIPDLTGKSRPNDFYYYDIDCKVVSVTAKPSFDTKKVTHKHYFYNKSYGSKTYNYQDKEKPVWRWSVMLVAENGWKVWGTIGMAATQEGLPPLKVGNTVRLERTKFKILNGDLLTSVTVGGVLRGKITSSSRPISVYTHLDKTINKGWMARAHTNDALKGGFHNGAEFAPASDDPDRR